MTVLADIIRQQIRATGPITLAEYMAFCLAHPEYGYYRSRDPLGEMGDFTTAPEISQMFGELVGLWLASQWQGTPCLLVEIGPGRGTLMADILRATAKVPGFHAAARICLIETSPVLIGRQQEALLGHDVEWFESIADLPEGPTLLIANEFFDVLPIRQFYRGSSGWQERMIGLIDDRLCLGLGPSIDLDAPDLPEGSIWETSPASHAIIAEIGARISTEGGAALVVDYGTWDGHGDTFQAIEKQKYSDPFARPGHADLTAHVHFKTLAEASNLHSEFTTQGKFLRQLGIEARAEVLSRSGQAERVAADLKRLTDAGEMGDLFKVLALVPHGADPLPGFT